MQKPGQLIFFHEEEESPLITVTIVTPGSAGLLPRGSAMEHCPQTCELTQQGLGTTGAFICFNSSRSRDRGLQRLKKIICVLMRSQIERLSINTPMPASKCFLYQNIVLGKTSAFPKSATDVSGPRFHPRHKGRAAQGKHKVWCCRGV